MANKHLNYWGDDRDQGHAVLETVPCPTCRGAAVVDIGGWCPECGGCGTVPAAVPDELVEIDLSHDAHRPASAPWTPEDFAAFAAAHGIVEIDVTSDAPPF